MKSLSLFDQMFLEIEKRQQPAHVGCLMLFSVPQSGSLGFENQLFTNLKKHTTPLTPYDLKLSMNGIRRCWSHDSEFDMEHHVRHIALPKPGRIRELLAYVSAEHSNLMHRERPLWECHLIEGIEGNRFAVYFKIHHAISDGVSAMHYLTRFLSNDSKQINQLPPWVTGENLINPEEQSKQNEPNEQSFFRASIMMMKGLPSMYRHIMGKVSAENNILRSMCGLRAPQTILNTRITGSRRYVAQSYSLNRFKAIARYFDCTLNDVILAVCGGALKQYLQSQCALPNEPLVAFVPASVRSDSSKGGNQIAMVQASLGTHIEDPIQRLLEVKASITVAKSRLQQLSKEEFLVYSAIALTPGVIHLMTGMFAGYLPCNVVISNVPGPKDALYWNGAKLQGLYPMSQPIDRVALNITLVSYNGSLEFGITACRRSMPSMQSLLSHIEKSVNELTGVIKMQPLFESNEMVSQLFSS